MKRSGLDPRTAALIIRNGRREQIASADRVVKGLGGRRPPDTTCQKCNAEFRWEQSTLGGWSMILVKSGRACDCGYGLALDPERTDKV
ncbi:MAG: hypothetical protein ACPGOY_10435 [Rhodospirillaceae bacterium]